jgi:threonine dehydratase
LSFTSSNLAARSTERDVLSVEDVRAAGARVQPYVVRTPLERSIPLSERCGVDVWLKLECFQATGSFKLRGALNALLLLTPDQREVVTASAGNHGLGVARAATLLDKVATVVVAETASRAKIEALRHSGAELVLHGPTYDEAEAEGLRLSRERGVPFISAYNHAAVVAGGGTVALEIFADLPEVRTLVVPAGGGGLIGGIGVVAHGLNQQTTVIGVQSTASPALHAALAHGEIVPVDVMPSLADGLSGNVEPGSITLGLLKEHVREVALVSEKEIAAAMCWLLIHERVVVEGSAAVGVAALLHDRLRRLDGPTVVILTGRNVTDFQATVSIALTRFVGAP